MTKDIKNYVVDDHPRITNFDNLTKEDLIKEIKRLENMNRFHQETNGELRQKISTVRELRKENSELRDKLKKRDTKQTSFTPSYSTLQIGKISGGMGANVIADKCSLEWEVRPINKEDGDFVTKNIDDFTNNILLPKFKKDNPKGDIKKEVVGEVVGFDKEDSSNAVDLICNLTGDNSKSAMSFGTEAGLFQNF